MAQAKQKSTTRKQIDENLKRVYDDALKQEVPDRFLDLIAQLKTSEGAPDGK